MKTFEKVVNYLESLSIMPKEMPGIEKIKNALNETTWFSQIDPKKVIVVAGTNGKGSTCAILEALLTQAGCQVGFYSSPHLIDTTERIRVGQKQISKEAFVQLFETNEALIEKHQLTHFEALTVMAADYFFAKTKLDFVLFEVGLGGTFDATNAIPHATSVITALGLDHTHILGTTIEEIAKNKFGIIKKNNLVVHHKLPQAVEDLKNKFRTETDSNWYEAEPVTVDVKKNGIAPAYILKSKWGETPINLMGSRAAENAATALTVFEKLGFNPSNNISALQTVQWGGRMQKVAWKNLTAPLYLSGDHNVQGLKSLLQILKDFSYKNLHIIVGIGKDKDSTPMLEDLIALPNVKLYLTETPFKGLTVNEYPEKFLEKAILKSKEVSEILDQLTKIAIKDDLVVVTGSLYLVGKVLSEIAANEKAT
ncbi:MAG: hypothetical protein H7256_12190 [Bdellovibrio sp.]|nr:hypothetical protein [Bdellovibrio sp.]